MSRGAAADVREIGTVRAVGSGFSYHAGAAVGSFAPTTIGWLEDSGWLLPNAMAVCILASMGVVVVMLWLGPETRGRHLTAVDGS